MITQQPTFWAADRKTLEDSLPLTLRTGGTACCRPKNNPANPAPPVEGFTDHEGKFIPSDSLGDCHHCEYPITHIFAGPALLPLCDLCHDRIFQKRSPEDYTVSPYLHFVI